MTGAELLKIAREGRPEVRYAMNDKGNAIGAWVDDMGRYVTVACKTIMGTWATMPYEVLVNGAPLPQTWVED